MTIKAYDGRIVANSIEIPLADRSVHMVMTSVPYWGLREYEIPDVIFGGRQFCVHTWGEKSVRGGPAGKQGKTSQRKGRSNSDAQRGRGRSLGRFCQQCGAWQGQLGLEPDPWLYIEHLLSVFDEIWRVLRSDGTVWLNLGDCYTDGGRGTDYRTGSTLQGARHNQAESRKVRVREKANTGMRTKNLVLMPWRIAIALQDQGWNVRSIICWNKGNCMPGSQQDRPTSSWEPVFLLSKSKRYYYDRVAVMEPCTGNSHPRGNGTGPKSEDGIQGLNRNNFSFASATPDVVLARNKRDVWTIMSEQLDEKHYAAYPESLVEPCILAGTSEHGCCADCGSSYTRIVEKQFAGDMCPDNGMREQGIRRTSAESKAKYRDVAKQAASRRMLENVKISRSAGGDHDQPFLPPKTVGWKKTCSCETVEIVKPIVLDPFAGSGTTARVAERLDRRWVSLDLGYQDMQARRMRGIQKRIPGLLCTQ